MFKEFKKFISKGNVFDLAVGVIIGGSFSKIVSSLVNDLLMPLIGILLGGLDFTNLSFKIKDATISYGMFIQNVIDFLIVAFSIFVFIKLINSLTNIKEKKKESIEVTETEISILKEIRDELKKNSKKK